MSSLIKLESVTKNYINEHSVSTVLHDINLTLEKGEMVAVIGKSGSGKSTLMNILGLLDKPSSGHYYFAGQDVSLLSDNALASIRNQSIGFVFQSFFLLPRSSVLQNVMLPLYYRGMPQADAKKQSLLMLDKVGLASLAEQLPHQLSGGQKQRVAIARALVGNPAIILADEPTGALDSQTGMDIIHSLKTLNREEGRTILIITHDDAISQQCQRVYVIKDGRLSLSLS